MAFICKKRYEKKHPNSIKPTWWDVAFTKSFGPYETCYSHGDKTAKLTVDMRGE